MRSRSRSVSTNAPGSPGPVSTNWRRSLSYRRISACPQREDLPMAIKVGDRLPNTTFTTMTADGPKPQSTDDIFKGKKVVLFAVPGAFTPTCHKNHLPGFLTNADKIKAKGVDTIAVTGVNDV